MTQKIANFEDRSFCFPFEVSELSLAKRSMTRFPCVCWENKSVHFPTIAFLLQHTVDIDRNRFTSSSSSVSLCKVKTKHLLWLVYIPSAFNWFRSNTKNLIFFFFFLPIEIQLPTRIDFYAQRAACVPAVTFLCPSKQINITAIFVVFLTTQLKTNMSTQRTIHQDAVR